eukprot:SM002322S07992  [mRNA]  locus=s2322:283:1729:+ [translate_table: standard]
MAGRRKDFVQREGDHPPPPSSAPGGSGYNTRSRVVSAVPAASSPAKAAVEAPAASVEGIRHSFTPGLILHLQIRHEAAEEGGAAVAVEGGSAGEARGGVAEGAGEDLAAAPREEGDGEEVLAAAEGGDAEPAAAGPAVAAESTEVAAVTERGNGVEAEGSAGGEEAAAATGAPDSEAASESAMAMAAETAPAATSAEPEKASSEQEVRGGDSAAAVGSGEAEAVQLSREDIKGALERYGVIRYIDFRRGEDSGYVRFEDPGAVADALASPGGANGFHIKGHVAAARKLEGDEEAAYWAKVWGEQDRRREAGGTFSDRGGRRGGRSVARCLLMPL